MAENNSQRASEVSIQAEDIDDPSDLVKDHKNKGTTDKNHEAEQNTKKVKNIQPCIDDDIEEIQSPIAPSIDKDMQSQNKPSARVSPVTDADMQKLNELADQSNHDCFQDIYRAVRGDNDSKPLSKPLTDGQDNSQASEEVSLGDGQDGKDQLSHLNKKKLTDSEVLRRKTTTIIKSWVKDSHNGRLSYSKMKYEVNQVHPRVLKDHQLQPMPCCSTRTGWFCCCYKCRRDEDISGELGTGMTIYFKTMKSFIILFLVFTIFSLPAFSLYWHGTLDSSTQSSSDAFARLTLGNIGQSSDECGQAIADGDSFQLFCSFGTMYSLNVYAVTNTNQQCDSTSLALSGTILPDCDISQTTAIQNWFNADCLGKEICTVNLNYSDFSSACLGGEPKMYAVTSCLGGNIDLPSGVSVDRITLTYIVVSCDIAICISYFIFLSVIQKFTNVEEHEINDKKLNICDFSVTVKDLPDESEYQSLDNLKVMLAKHFNKILPNKQQRIEKLRGTTEEEDIGTVSNIFFGHTNFEGYEILMAIEKLCLQIILIEEKQKKNPKNHDKYQKEIEKMQIKAYKLQDKYVALDQAGTKDQIKTAYIVFNSMESAERAIHAYSDGWCNRLCLKCCCRSKELKDRYFQKKWLNVDRGTNPSLIQWQNLGSRKRDRCFRVTITTIVAFLLCLATIAAIIYAKDIDTQSKEFSPVTDCPTSFTITRQMAYDDYILPKTDSQGYMSCYCKDGWIQAVKEGVGNSFLEQDFSDGQQYCYTWFQSYAVQQALLLTVPLIISVTNSISKTVMRFLAKFEKSQSKAEEVYTSTRNMFLISFINTGLVILLVNFKFNLPSWLSWLPVFNGSYTSFSVEWYKNVGATLAVTMIFFIFTPHISNCMFQGLSCFSRCCDRGCRCDSRRTSKITQQEYENVNIGAEFQMEFRYSNILVVVLITMMYSPGLPVLYPVALGFFFVTYFVDKCMLLRMYRKPVLFDKKLALDILFWFKMAMVLHALMGIFMFSNPKILPSQDQVAIDTTILGQAITFDWSDLFSLHMVIYWGMFLGLLFIACFQLTIAKCCMKLFSNCRKVHETINSAQTPSANFFENLSYQFLRKEYAKNESQIKRYNDLLKIGQVFQPQLTEDDMQKYIAKLIKNREAMSEIFQKIDNSELKKEDIDLKKDIQDLTMKLDGMDHNNELAEVGSLVNAVESYDILENPTFVLLQPLRKILDRKIDAKKVAKLRESHK